MNTDFYMFQKTITFSYEFLVKMHKKSSCAKQEQTVPTGIEPVFRPWEGHVLADRRRNLNKKSQTSSPAYIPQGGFEPPQWEPESQVLPLHNRGMQCAYKIQGHKKKVNSKSLFLWKFLVIEDFDYLTNCNTSITLYYKKTIIHLIIF